MRGAPIVRAVVEGRNFMEAQTSRASVSVTSLFERPGSVWNYRFAIQ
jgi:hypothetical protein